MDRAPARKSASSPPWRFLLLALAFGGGVWWVHRVEPGRYPAADRVRRAVDFLAAKVVPARAAESSPAPAAPDAPTAPLLRVERVVDGDTVVLEGGDKVRLIGINTPETVDPRRPVQWYGKEASARAKALLSGKRVRMEQDVEKKDRYGRTLGYLRLEDGTFVNLRMVEEGYAFAYPYPPNVKYEALFRDAEARAREGRRGLWSDAAKAAAIAPKSKGRK